MNTTTEKPATRRSVRGFLEITEEVRNRMGEVVKTKTQLYQFSPVRDCGPGTVRCWRIHNQLVEDQHGKGVYTVSLMNNGHVGCTCPDAIYRERECRHVLAMKAMGLL